MLTKPEKYAGLMWALRNLGNGMKLVMNELRTRLSIDFQKMEKPSCKLALRFLTQLCSHGSYFSSNIGQVDR